MTVGIVLKGRFRPCVNDRRKKRRQDDVKFQRLLFMAVFMMTLLLWIVGHLVYSAKGSEDNFEPNDVIIRTFSELEAAEYASKITSLKNSKNEEASEMPVSGAENDHWIPQDTKDNGGYQQKWQEALPVVFVVTPTYSRHLQRAELTRLSQTLRLVTNLHWILVEDSESTTSLVTMLLAESGVRYTHLNTRTNQAYRDYIKKLPRGVDQRNKGLQWLRNAIQPGSVDGVVYFADDDNVYDIELFEKIRWTKGVSIFPVGWTGVAKWSGPLCRNGRVFGFHTNYAPERKFPTDMAGFAVNLNVLLVDKANARFKPIRGLIETTFLEQLTTMEKIEGVPHNCSEVLVWHTRTKIPRESLKGENELLLKGEGSDPEVET